MINKDERTLLSAKNGNIEAFEKLMENYYIKVFSIALAVCGDSEKAGELAQETFLRLYKTINDLEDSNSLAVWVYKTARDVCIREYKEQKVS